MSHLSVVKDDGDLDRIIEYSLGGQRGLGYVSNKRAPWGKMVDVLTSDRRTDMTTKQYHALSADEKQKEKMRAGFIVGGHCDDGKRVARAIQKRSFLNLDIDNLPVEDFHQFQFDLNSGEGFFANEFIWHTTRSHTPEKPKFRIIVPLKKPIEAEKFVAASRILASKFDATMVHVDTVSFVLAQIMYKPLTNRDGEFLAGRNTGSFLDADKMLEEFGDWRDFSKLPCREDETLGRLVAPGTKQENPFEKKGIVGAFNRAYPIEEVIDTYLSDVYERSSEVSSNGVRYTYLKSETGQSNGVLVYPEQGLLFSHHSSDPCGNGHSYNAFDAVRLHLYSHLDESVKGDTSPMKYPSFKEMQERFKSDEAVSKELLQERYDIEAITKAAMADLDEEDERPEPTELKDGEDALGNDADDLDTDAWVLRLDRGEGGVIKPTVPNVVTILTHDKRVAGMFAKNRMTRQIVKLRSFPAGTIGTMPGKKKVQDEPVFDDQNGDDWTDEDDAKLMHFLSLASGKGSANFGLNLADRVLTQAIRVVGDAFAFHPIKRYFEATEWDGEERVTSLFVDYLGCPDDDYHRQTAELALIAAVARIYEPGIKWDHVPILEGGQGIRKSTFIRVLANHWFAEMRGHDIDNNQKTAELLEGAMLVEIPELHAFSKAESNALKGFFSSMQDKARPAFGKRTLRNRRQSSFWGSTNEGQYLRDRSGNRRYWPIVVLIASIDIDRLIRNLDQIWAEALTKYRAMRDEQPVGDLPLYIPAGTEAAEVAKRLQDERLIDLDQDRDKGSLAKWLDTLVPRSMANCNEDRHDDEDLEDGFSAEPLIRRDLTCVAEIIDRYMMKDYKDVDQRRSQTIAKALAAMENWVPCGRQPTEKYGRQRCYRRVGSDILDIVDPAHDL